MLIFQIFFLGRGHGQWIAHSIERGSLYPALHHLQNRGWIVAFWGTAENNRKAKYYRSTPEGKRQLSAHTSRWKQLVRAISRILNTVAEKQA